MARRGRRYKGEPPEYLHHKASGRAYCTVDGKPVYLGPFNSPESRAKHDKIRKDWFAAHPTEPLRPLPNCTVTELAAAFLQHADTHYRRPDGTRTSEYVEYVRLLGRLCEAHGTLSVDDFRPSHLKAFRQSLIDADHCLRTINQSVGRLRHVFKWGVGEELVRVETLTGLRAVPDLREGRRQARETEPVGDVAEEVVEAALPYLPSDQLRAMVRLQLLTGMRPGEACIVTTADIARAGEFTWQRRRLKVPDGCWVYVPEQHKGLHQGKLQAYLLGPRAQELLRPWLRESEPEAYLFQPREAAAALNAERRQRRKTKVQPSQASRAKKAPARGPGDHYLESSYTHACALAQQKANDARLCETCKAALDSWLCPKCAGRPGQRRCRPCRKAVEANRCEACRATALPHWHLNQIRHTVACKVDAAYNLEAASHVLGHMKPDTTLIYTQRKIEQAARIMSELG